MKKRDDAVYLHDVVDLRAVWDTAKSDLPGLREWGERVLAGDSS